MRQHSADVTSHRPLGPRDWTALAQASQRGGLTPHTDGGLALSVVSRWGVATG